MKPPGLPASHRAFELIVLACPGRTGGEGATQHFRMSTQALRSLHGVTRAELASFFEQEGLSPVHLARLWSLLYWECVTSWEELGALPRRVLHALREHFTLTVHGVLQDLSSSDGLTRKFLLRLDDGRAIEAVLMRFRGRFTACLSSQVGCAMGCGFCATGQMGYVRNLSAAEIVAQALHLQRLLRATGDLSDPASSRLRNIVLMGMGEPLHNYDEVLRAVEIFRDQSGFALSPARITLSTVGVIPGILRLAQEARPMHLAVSLHAATQQEREALIPVARKWPLDELIEACRVYSRKLERRVFFEWTLIDGVNDRPEDARAVGRLLADLPAQVNLIPLNPTSGFAGGPGRTEAARRFQDILIEEFKIPCTVRQRRGIDIAAGCGQLAAPRGSA